MGRNALPKNPRAGLPTRAAAEYCGVSVGFLETDRQRVMRGDDGHGPAFRRVGRDFRYDRGAIDAWRSAMTFDPLSPPLRRRKRARAAAY